MYLHQVWCLKNKAACLPAYLELEGHQGRKAKEVLAVEETHQDCLVITEFPEEISSDLQQMAIQEGLPHMIKSAYNVTRCDIPHPPKSLFETTMCPRQRLTRDGWKTTYCYPVTLKWIWAVKAEAFMGLLIP